MSSETGRGPSSEDIDRALAELQNPQGRFYAKLNGGIQPLGVTHQASPEAHIAFERWLAENRPTEHNVAGPAIVSEVVDPLPSEITVFSADTHSANPAEGTKPAA